MMQSSEKRQSESSTKRQCKQEFESLTEEQANIFLKLVKLCKDPTLVRNFTAPEPVLTSKSGDSTTMASSTMASETSSQDNSAQVAATESNNSSNGLSEINTAAAKKPATMQA